MAVIIGSARLGSNGSITGDKPGDQKQTGTPDYSGEVSMQKFYVHSKGWYVLRPKSITHANKIAERMVALCNNKHYGYNQLTRLDVINNGIDSNVDGGCDCSSGVRACVKEATGKDPGNFITDNEVSYLEKTGLFESKTAYVSGMKLYQGDVLVTKTRGHTVVVCYSDYSRSSVSEASSGKTNASSTAEKAKKITEDGWWGIDTTRAAQKVFKTTLDGIVSKQVSAYHRPYLPHCLTTTWRFYSSPASYKGGSQLVKAIQKWGGASQDGIAGKATVKAVQKKVGATQDGVMGEITVTLFQKYLNKYL